MFCSLPRRHECLFLLRLSGDSDEAPEAEDELGVKIPRKQAKGRGKGHRRAVARDEEEEEEGGEGGDDDDYLAAAAEAQEQVCVYE